MTRDPLFLQIKKALSEPLDGDAFEACAADVLRDAYPRLAPVRGGKDAGFDGAISTSIGPMPLITTTRSDVLTNVRHNLKQYLATAKGPKRAVVATSRRLTPTRRANILAAAQELGVVVQNIHDQDDFANRLYRNSRWLEDLLGISGHPPALSMFPLRARFDHSPPLVGREPEYHRVIHATTDLLIVGQPGSGKTFLHEQLAGKGEAAFVVDSDIKRIAADVREQQPRRVVVDDAHLRLPLLDELRHLRTTTGAKFAIHANCWPSFEEGCRARLGIGASDVVHLRLLTRDEIVKVIQGCRVQGPDSLTHMILNQAEGKPGLAVLLVEACLRGDADRVWTGEAVAEYLLAGKDISPQDPARAILAAFAVGGDAGMSMSVVAKALSLNLVEVRRVVTELDAAGVIEECGADVLAVRPQPLQALLVKDVFYGGASSLPIDGLLSSVRNRETAAHVLWAFASERVGHPSPISSPSSGEATTAMCGNTWGGQTTSALGACWRHTPRESLSPLRGSCTIFQKRPFPCS